MLLSLDDLAKKHGQIAAEVVDGGRYKWPHRVADHIHGWTVHNYHHQADQIMLSDDDYLSAIKAAECGITPHPPAVAAAPDYLAKARVIDEARAKADAAPMLAAPEDVHPETEPADPTELFEESEKL